MEQKLHYICLGDNVPIEKILSLQNQIVEHFRQTSGVNIMYSFSPKPFISLGMDHENNKLHPKLESEVMKEEASENRTKNIARYIKKNFPTHTVIDNSKYRPGGSTYNGPGQRTFFFNLDFTQILKNFDELKSEVDTAMIETLNRFTDEHKFEYERQIDIFTKIQNLKHKIASQGFRISSNENRVMQTQYGLTFHLNEEGIIPFSNIILPCGVEPKTGVATSLENLIGEFVNPNIFDEEFSQIFAEKIGLEICYSSPIIDAIKKTFNRN